MRGQRPLARRLLPLWRVKTSLLRKPGRDEPLVRGRVVPFRRPARGGVPVARRRPSVIPASVVWFDQRRIATRRRLFPTLEWLVVGLAATLRLCLKRMVFACAGPRFLTAEAVTLGSAEHGGGNVSNEERSS